MDDEKFNEIKKLIEENLQVNREVHQIAVKIDKYIKWQKIFGVVKVLFIVVPIIIGFIYLPPLLREYYEQYQELLGIDIGELFSAENKPEYELVDSIDSQEIDDLINSNRQK